MLDFWQLPGPARFLTAVADDLRGGSSVVAIFPQLPPADWVSALSYTAEQNSISLDRFTPPASTPPLRALAQTFSPEHAVTVRTVTDLVRLPQLQGRGVHLELCPQDDWPAWHAFVRDFADAVRRSEIRPCDRAVFLLTRVAGSNERPPESEVALRVHLWAGAVDRLDMQLWSAQLLAGSAEPVWQRQLRAAIAVELALWDSELCSQACSLTLGQLVSPTTWLASFNQIQGRMVYAEIAASPSNGTDNQQVFEGRQRNHSAWLAMQSRQNVIDRRVWKAQLAVIYPLLESHRQVLLVAHNKLWRIPWETKYGRIEQLEDLELNHLADQLWAHRSGGLREVYEFVCWLRDMRNDLAHLTPVSSQRLLEQRFQARFSHCVDGDD